MTVHRLAQFHRLRGNTRLKQGDYAGALADLDAALRLDPQLADAYRHRSAARLLAGDLAGAEEDAKQAVALRPGVEAHAQCGAVFQCEQDFAAAVEQYSRAIDLNPHLFWAYLLRGNAYYHLGALEETYADYRRALQLAPGLAVSHMVRILRRLIGADPAAALADCDAYLRHHPDDFLTYGRRGVTLLLLGRDAEAQTDLTEFQRRSPRDADWLRLVIDFVRQSGPKPAAAPCPRQATLDELFIRAGAGESAPAP
jgi:tetratricopeptide (TPR) repeat protein